NAAGGSVNLARTEGPAGHTVAVTSALGRTTSHGIEALSVGDERRVSTYPDGTSTETVLGTDGGEKAVFSDGTTTTALEGPDPRFSMQAPMTTSVQIANGGLTATLGHSRTVALQSTGDPLSLTTLTDQLSVNGRTSTTAYTAATRTFLTTSP